MRITVKQLKRLIKEALSELPSKIDPSTYKPNESPVAGLLVNGIARSYYTTSEKAKEIAKKFRSEGYRVALVDLSTEKVRKDFFVRGTKLRNQSYDEIYNQLSDFDKRTAATRLDVGAHLRSPSEEKRRERDFYLDA